MNPVRIPLGVWAPDQPELVNQGLTVAKNVVPVAGGYGPQPSLASVSGFGVLSERPRGATSLIDAGGNPHHYAGTETKIYRLSLNGTEDVSRTGTAYACADSNRWEFALFGTTLVAVSPTDETQFIDVLVGTNFEKLHGDATAAPAFSEGTAPRAHHIGLVENHLVLGNVIDPVFGHVPNSLWWPQIQNPFHWPGIASDDAVAAQSDRQILEGDGGWVQRIIGGSEVGIVFQERAIWRMDYVGGDVIFNLTRVEPNRGMLSPGMAIAVGRVIYFCAEDGWYAFDYTTSQPLGKEVVNRYFFNDLDFDNMHRTTMAVDPDATRIYCLYPGAGNTGGAPNKYLCFDWGLGQSSHGELNAEMLLQSLPSAINLDSGSDPDDVDAADQPSFDVRQADTGSLRLGAFDHSHQLGEFTGAALAATLETGHLELDPGHWTLVSSVAPLVQGAESPTVQVAALPRHDSTVSFGPPSGLQVDGAATTRANGRYHRFRVNIPAGGFDSAVAVELRKYARTGTR